jgi:hypothetical protein
MTRYTFTLPKSFQPAEFLPPRLLTRADDARYLVSQIVHKTANKDVDPWGCVRLHSDILRRVMYSPTEPAVVEALEAAGAIETAPYYAGVKAKGYRLAKRFLGDDSVQVRATDPRLIARIEAERQRQQTEEQRNRWLPVHYTLDREQEAVTITKDADAILERLPEHTRLCQHVLVSRIQRREFPFSVSSTGRVFNSITGLKRELREALRLDGEHVGSVDIRCAQPALLAFLLCQDYPANGLLRLSTYKHAPLSMPLFPAPACPTADVLTFSELATAGILYERIIEATGLARDEVKLSFLRDVLAKKGRYPSVVESAFRDAFPTVHRIIRAVNRHDHGELIRLLQRAESWLVVETVAPRLIGRVPIVTLHDAIYSRRREVGTVADAFHETFKDLGCSMGLKVEG